MNKINKLAANFKGSYEIKKDIRALLGILYKRTDNNLTDEIVQLIDQCLENTFYALTWEKNITAIIDFGINMLACEHLEKRREEIIKSFRPILNKIKCELIIKD
jgi:hypothetical protein